MLTGHVLTIAAQALDDLARLTLPCPWCGGERVKVAVAPLDIELVLCAECDATHDPDWTAPPNQD